MAREGAICTRERAMDAALGVVRRAGRSKEARATESQYKRVEFIARGAYGGRGRGQGEVGAGGG